MPTLRTVTLGCKVNQYETQYVREGLLRAGYQDAPRGQPADLCVINTCTVTAEGDLKSRKMIRQLARQNPHAEIVVMGCYATRRPNEAASLPGVAEVIVDKADLPDFLARRGLQEPIAGITSFGSRHRAYVKVQDGCTQRCAYCIIPHARPTLRSRPMADVLREVEQLAGCGYREVVLTGIHLGYYGADFHAPGIDLARLVGAIARIDADFRLRISSLEAAEVSDPLIELLQTYPAKLCPHLHLSMQSGSDTVLQRMRRRYTRSEFIRCCRRIGERLDKPALTTDVIVGFPGETDADFDATLDACREVGFSKIHIFRFSPREGTPAATMEDQLHGSIKKLRADRLADLEHELRGTYLDSLRGQAVQVLVEREVREAAGWLSGTSDRYAPVTFRGPASAIGRLVRVHVEQTEGHQLMGTIVDDKTTL